MFKQYSKAAPSIFITTSIICLAILAGRYLAVSLADGADLSRADSATAKQYSPPASIAETQRRLNNSDAAAIPTRHFEPFWLLALGATLLTIGASIKHIAGTAAKAPLRGGKTKRAL